MACLFKAASISVVGPVYIIAFFDQVGKQIRGSGALAEDCLVRNACVPGSNPADPKWGFQRNIVISPFSTGLGDHVNGGLVELKLKQVHRR